MIETLTARRILLRRAFRQHTGGVIGAVLLFIMVVLALAAPILAPAPPNRAAPRNAYQPPGLSEPMGTDNLGRDVLSRWLYGGRVSLRVGVLAALLGSTAGTLLGLIAGYFGGWIDRVVSWLIEVLMSLPGILLAMLVLAILGTGIDNLIVAVGISFIPSFTRLARASALQEREQDYVLAARALGAGSARIMLRHILPNTLRPLLVLVSFGTGSAILEGAALSFLGLGIQPPDPEWGAMVSAGRGFMAQAWWMTVFTGLGIFLTILAMNLLGDALGDLTDPHQHSR